MPKKLSFLLIVSLVLLYVGSIINFDSIIYAEEMYVKDNIYIEIESDVIDENNVNAGIIHSMEEIENIKIYINSNELSEDYYSIEKNVQVDKEYLQYLNQYRINLSGIELVNGEYLLKVYVKDIQGEEAEKIQPIQFSSTLNNKTDILSNEELIVIEENPTMELATTIENSPVIQSENLLVEVNKPVAIIHSLDVSEGGYVGTEYKLTAIATSPNTTYYQYAIEDLATKKWMFLSSYAETNTGIWIPDKAGEYRIRARVKDSQSVLDQDSRIDYFVTVQQPKAQITDLNVLEGDYVGAEYKLIATATSPNTTLYQYAIEDLATKKWMFLSSYAETNTGIWVPDKAGEYRIRARVKDSQSVLDQDSRIDYFVTVQQPKAQIIDLNVLEGDYVGAEYKLTATATSPNTTLYQYAIEDLATKKWTFLSSYTETNTGTWVPDKAGEYRIRARVKDSQSVLDQDSRIDYLITVQQPKAQITDLNVLEGDYVGAEYKLTATATSPNTTLYQYAIEDLATKQWTFLSPYTESNTGIWIPDKAGEYRIRARVKDSESKLNQDNRIDYFVKVLPLEQFRYTSYNYTLSQIIDIQINSSPQTDKYRNQPVYIESKYVDECKSNSAMVKQNVRIRTSPNTSSSNNIYMSTTSPVEVEILDKNIKGSSYEGSTVWYKIKHNNNSNLYVHSKLIDETGKIYYRVNSITPVRSDMNVNSHTYGTIKSGDTINVRKTSSSNWYEVIGYGTWRNPTRQDLEQYVSPKNWIVINTETINANMYQFLVLSGSTGVAASQLDTELQGKGVLAGKGSAFVEASRRNNVNEAYLMAHAFLETGNGTSTLAKGVMYNGKKVYNIFGIGALDQDPINLGAKRAYEEGWFTIEDAIIGGANWIARNYINNATYKQDTLYKMRWNPAKPGQHQYATDIGWAVKQTKSMDIMVDICLRNGIRMAFDIPVYK